MTTSIETYWALTELRNGQTMPPRGSVVVPECSARSLTGNFFRVQTQTVAASAKRIVWDYAQALSFQYFYLFILDTGGVLETAFWTDTPTSASDNTPTGTYGRWRLGPQLSCGNHYVFNTQNTILDPTLSNESADASGFPKGWDTSTDGTRKEAKIYKIAVWNRNTSAINALESGILY